MHLPNWFFSNLHEIIGYLMALILMPRILLERRHPGATVAWLLAIGLMPYVGVPLYFLIGGRTIQRISREKHWSMTEGLSMSTFEEEAALPPHCRKIAHLLRHTGTFPLSADNEVRLMDNGVEAYGSLMRMLKEARTSIEIATFILGRDEVGRAIVKALAEKAREGVEVRLLLDALGSLRTRGRFVQPIRDAGGHVGVFLPLLPIRRKWSANLRNHRKIIIVDREEAIVGGMNLTTEYMGPAHWEKRWKDVSMEIKGPAVKDLFRLFAQDWTYSTGETIALEAETPPAKKKKPGPTMVQVVGDGPDINARPLYSGVMAAIGQAKKSIWVVTPYFIPDEPLSAALTLAARLGNDVRIIIPEHSNHPLVDLASRSLFPDLMEAGVRFYLYRPRMLHAKLIAIDGHLAVVGSANMDIRSFNLNFEVATFLYSAADVKKVIAVMKSVMGESRKLTHEELGRKGGARRFAEDICRVFSPLL
jgi:cardiolipin synthase